MKTEDFISLLVADRRAGKPPGRHLLRLMFVAIVVAGVALLMTAGLRADIAAAASTTRVLFKWLLALTLFAVASGTVLRLARPGMRVGVWAAGLFGVVLALALAVAIELWMLPSEQWVAAARGTNATWCLRIIPVLSIPPFVAALRVLHEGAPTRPALAGAAAGLLAGSVGAALYALHCTDDSPLFVATWYSLAVLAVSAAGALLGPRILRW